MQETNEVQYAGFFVRLAAAALDAVIIFAMSLIIRFPVLITSLITGSNILSTKVLFNFTIYNVVLYLLAAAYRVLLTYFTGATIGKRVLKLRVIKEDGTLDFITVLYRETIGKFLSRVVLCIGYLLIGIDQQKRGLHDILCDTCVIYNFEEKEKNLESTYF